jgi:hypothetical protein
MLKHLHESVVEVCNMVRGPSASLQWPVHFAPVDTTQHHGNILIDASPNCLHFVRYDKGRHSGLSYGLAKVMRRSTITIEPLLCSMTHHMVPKHLLALGTSRLDKPGAPSTGNLSSHPSVLILLDGLLIIICAQETHQI